MAGVAGDVFTTWEGLERVERTAKKRQIAQKAVRAGAKLVQQAAKARAPKRKRSGALKRSIGIKAAKGRKGKTLAYAVVGARRKVITRYKGRKTVPANYAHLVEKGTKPHSLLKRAKGALAKLKRLAQVKAGVGRQHPGAKAKPFLRPALESQRQAAYSVMLRTLAAEVEKELAKQAAKPKG